MTDTEQIIMKNVERNEQRAQWDRKIKKALYDK